MLADAHRILIHRLLGVLEGKYESTLHSSDSIGEVAMAVDALDRIKEAEWDAIPVPFLYSRGLRERRETV